MTRASDNEYPSVLLDEQAAAPTTPATGFWRVYAKSDGLYIVDDAGAETGPLGTGGGGGGQTIVAGQQTLTNDTISAADTYEQWGTEELGLGDLSGETVTVIAHLTGYISTNAGAEQYFARLQVSFDGGSTWSDGPEGARATDPASQFWRIAVPAQCVLSASATGIVQVRAQLQGTSTTGTFAGGVIVATAYY